MMIGGIRGDECEGKDWGWFSCAALSNIWCQEMGIVCVPSWISMRQKRGWCRGCSMAEPTTEGGGEYWQPSNERMPCQKGAMIPHSKVWWHSLLPDAQCTVCATWARCSHVERKGPLFYKQTLSICGTSGYVLCEPEVPVESHHLWCILSNKLRSAGVHFHLTGQCLSWRLDLGHNFQINFNVDGATNMRYIFWKVLAYWIQKNNSVYFGHTRIDIECIKVTVYTLHFNVWSQSSTYLGPEISN